MPFRIGDMIIELAGGNRPVFRPNLDIRHIENVDIIANIEYSLPIRDDSADGIYCSYAIEHISWRKIRYFIKEIYRILKTNGSAIFVTANLLEQARKVAITQEWSDQISQMIFGDLDYPENSHKSGFSPEYAIKLFKEAGFATVNVAPLPQCVTDLIIEAVK